MNEEDRKIIFDAANKVAKFIHDNRIQNVVVLGYSGQMGAYTVKLAWQHLYGKKPMPHFFAVGSFVSQDIVKGKRPWKLEDELVKLKKKLPNLFSDKNKSEDVLLFDSFLYSGMTMTFCRKFFEESGFTKINTGALFEFTRDEIQLKTQEPHTKSHIAGYYTDKSSTVLEWKRWDFRHFSSRTGRFAPKPDRIGFNKLNSIKSDIRKLFSKQQIRRGRA